MEKNIAKSKQHTILAGTMMEQTTYSGPLPAPSDFAAYKETLPSAPERIMAMAETEQAHRHEIEKDVLYKTGRESLIGQILAFLLALACLGIATYLGLQGHDTLAGAIIAIAAVLSSIFYLKKNPQQKEENK